MQNLKTKSTFHEIKNQLSVCDLYLEIIKKTLVKEKIENEGINRALMAISNSLKSMVNSMHELKAQFNPINISETDISSLINDVFLAGVSYVGQKDVEFINYIEPDLKINCDKEKMYSVFINLCKNAVEAIPKKGFIKIYNDNNAIYIENNGEPIPPDIKAKIFDDGFTTKNDGSGLGLMLVKKFLNLQNFDIELVSSDEAKTIFKIFGI